MKSILAIAKVTFIEQIRNRLYLIILFFGGSILAASLLLGTLAPGYKVRVVFDLGLVAIELFGLTTAIFGAVSLVVQEIESKTIYLLLTRPLPRSSYIIGRYLGLLGAVVMTMLGMALLHIGTMLSDFGAFKEFMYSTPLWANYPLLLLMSISKMFITASLALFFSLFATSSVSALVFTAFFWIAGHFGPELAFLIKKSTSGFIQSVAKAVSLVFPNFQFLNFRDLFEVPGFSGVHFIGWALLYSFGYAAIFIVLSSILFSKKEF